MVADGLAARIAEEASSHDCPTGEFPGRLNAHEDHTWHTAQPDSGCRCCSLPTVPVVAFVCEIHRRSQWRDGESAPWRMSRQWVDPDRRTRRRIEGGDSMSTDTTPDPAQTTTPTPPQGNLQIFGSAVVSGLIAIGGLLLTIYTQKPGVIVPWALCVLGLTAFAPIAPRVPRWAQVCTTFVIAVALIESSIVVFADPRLLTRTTTVSKTVNVPGPVQTVPGPVQTIPGPVQTPTPPAAPHLVFTHPADGDTSPVDGCLTITWRGDPPDDWAYAVGNRAPGDDLTYYEGLVERTPSGDWTVTVSLGDTGVGMGKIYQIAVIMMPKELHDYLQNVQGDDSLTWWAGAGDPPGSQPVTHISATRNNKSALGGDC